MGSFKGSQDGLHGAGRRADDENTPLLGQRHQRSEQPILSRSDTVLSASQNGNQVFSSEDEVDEEEMNLELAKTMSVPQGLGVDPLPPLINQKPKRYPSIGTEPDEDSTIKHVISSASIESKFIGISVARFWTVFGGILFGYWIAMFDSSIMASSHPVITSYFHSSNAASWLSTVFLLFNTSFQPLAGRVSDTFGRRPVYIFSIAIFFFATAWCALAQSMISFIFARGVCGIGAGGIGAMGQIITSDLVLLEYRGVYQSYVNLIFGLGLACGAAFGGFLCDNLGWRAMFGIQLPLILAYLVLAVATTPKDIGPNLSKTENRTFRETLKTFDIAGSLTLTVTVTFLILGLNLGGNIFSWTHPAVISSLVLFCITSAFLVRIEKKAPLPVVPLELLSSQPRANLVFNSFFGKPQSSFSIPTLTNLPD
jgi:MFS family permease